MLLPEKHITLAESTLGLGALLIDMLDKPRTLDYLFKQTRGMRETGEINAFHDFDSITIAVLFLYATGIVENTETGAIRRCGS